MRHRFKQLLAVALLAAAPAATADAQASASRYYEVCGGSYAGWSGVGLCASVNVSVRELPSGRAVVTLTVRNMSGLNGSYSGSVFTGVGLDNVMPPSINVINGSLRVTGPCASEPSRTCDFSNHWGLANDKAIGGGVKVDLLNSTDRGVNYSLASSCGLSAGTAPGTNTIVTACGATGGYAEISFEVTSYFDPNLTSTLYVKAQNGYNGGSTTCQTSSLDCTVAPEPATVTLVAGGLAAIGLARRRRRRRLEGSESDG